MVLHYHDKYITVSSGWATLLSRDFLVYHVDLLNFFLVLWTGLFTASLKFLVSFCVNIVITVPIVSSTNLIGRVS